MLCKPYCSLNCLPAAAVEDSAAAPEHAKLVKSSTKNSILSVETINQAIDNAVLQHVNECLTSL